MNCHIERRGFGTSEARSVVQLRSSSRCVASRGDRTPVTIDLSLRESNINEETN